MFKLSRWQLGEEGFTNLLIGLFVLVTVLGLINRDLQPALDQAHEIGSNAAASADEAPAAAANSPAEAALRRDLAALVKCYPPEERGEATGAPSEAFRDCALRTIPAVSSVSVLTTLIAGATQWVQAHPGDEAMRQVALAGVRLAREAVVNEDAARLAAAEDKSVILRSIHGQQFPTARVTQVFAQLAKAEASLRGSDR